MKDKMITVLKVEPGLPPAVKEIRNDLDGLQAEVEGLIECINLPNGCVVVCNEEGKLNGMPPNRRLGADILCGSFFVCGSTQGGDFSSLSKSQIAEYSQLFAEVPAFCGAEPELEPRMTFIEFHY
ncbi:MAG: DUF3846 domain-containing protein [Oscillospiraceae bacterium]|nr:DUF3846 domain-containing protein [Oscillospiraceae bacterium]MDD4510655.1 DUF3846 domain-containing protein [Oscillospiraceae bacterium]